MVALARLGEGPVNVVAQDGVTDVVEQSGELLIKGSTGLADDEKGADGVLEASDAGVHGEEVADAVLADGGEAAKEGGGQDGEDDGLGDGVGAVELIVDGDGGCVFVRGGFYGLEEADLELGRHVERGFGVDAGSMRGVGGE